MEGKSPRPSTLLDVTALLVSWACLYLAGRGEGWFSVDALRYASVAKDLSERGDLTDLRMAGEPYWNKPPLVFALTALSFRALGRTRLAGTLPSALFALGAMLVTRAVTGRLLGRKAGWFAAFALGSTPLFVRYGATLRLDAPLAFFVSAAVAAALFARDRPRLLLLFGPMVGLGILAKGPGGLLPLGIVALLSVQRRESFPWNRPVFWSGLGLGAAVAAPWHVAMAARHGESFLGRFLGHEIAERFFGGSGSDETPLVYLVSLVTWGGQPWLFLAIAGAVSMCRRPAEGDRDLRRLLLAWALPVLAPLALVRPPYARYLVPALPCLAVLAARGAASWLTERRFALLRNGILLFNSVLLVAISSGAIRVSRVTPREIAEVGGILRTLRPSVRILSPVVSPGPGRAPTELRAFLDFYLDGMRVEEFPLDTLPDLSPRPGDVLVLHHRTTGAPPPTWTRVFDGREYDVYRPTPGGR